MIKKEEKLIPITKLNKNMINKEVFDKEIAICKKLSREGDCAWGKCESCGVIPLLYKLHKGELLEDPVKIKEIKNMIFEKHD